MLKLSLVVFPACHPQRVSISLLVLVPVPTLLNFSTFFLLSYAFSLYLLFPWFSLLFLISNFFPFSLFSSFVCAFASVASHLVVTAHPISPLPCQYQETSTCLQMRRRQTVREERKAGVQHLWIIDMGQKGDITGDQKISSYISIHRETQFAAGMSAGTFAHIRIFFHWFGTIHTHNTKAQLITDGGLSSLIFWHHFFFQLMLNYPPKY